MMITTRPRTALALGLLACLLAPACKLGKRCDPTRLAALAQAIDAAPAEARAGLVDAQLAGACELVPSMQTRLEPSPQARRAAPEGLSSAGFAKAVRRACSSWGRFGAQLSELPSSKRAALVYRECDFGRYELIPFERFAAASDPALATFAIHALMLDEGTPEPVAKSISRAVFELEMIASSGPAIVEVREDIQLTQAQVATPLRRGEIVYVSPSRLEFDEKTLAGLDAGRLAGVAVQNHLIPALYDALAQALDLERQVAERLDEAIEARLLLALDARTPVDTLVDLLYTGGRAEYASYGLVVETEYPMRRMIELSAPKFGERLDAAPLRVFISAEGFRVRGAGDEVLLPPREGQPDYAGLERLAREHLVREPQASYAMVRASGELPVELLLRTLATLAGPACVQSQPEPEACLLPRLMLEASV